MDKFEEIQQSLGAGPMDAFLNASGGTRTHSLDDVKIYIGVKVDNNFSGAVASLAAHGYRVGAGATHGAVAKMLLKIYHDNRQVFLAIMRGIPENAGANNYTTSPSFAATFKKYIGALVGGHTTAPAKGRVIQNLNPPTG